MVKWLCAYALLMGLGVNAFGAFVPLYAHERLGFSVAEAGTVMAVSAFFGIVARFSWAQIANVVPHVAIPLAVLGLLSVASQVALWAADHTATWLVWVGAVGIASTAGAWNAAGMVAVVKLLDRADVGRASGMVLLAFYTGYVASPVLFGLSVDVTGGYEFGWGAVTACYLGAAVVAVAWHVRERCKAPHSA
jgi:MFS family permease